MASITRKSATEKALADLRDQQQRLARWEADKATGEAELASLQQRAGEEVLDDESATAGAKLARSMTELRDRIDIASRAITAQQPRVTAAERAYLLAQADEYEKPLAAARAALQRHEARTSELLRALEEHEGRYVPEHEALERERSERAAAGVRVQFDAPKSWLLQDAVAQAERPVTILRALADGREPKVDLNPGESLADAYPACAWGPGAVVPAPAYLRAVETARRELATIDERTERLPREIEEREAELVDRASNVRFPDIDKNRRWLEKAPQLRAEAEARLAELTGEPDAAEAGV